MLSRRAVCAALAVTLPLAAAAPGWAHGPTRQKVQTQVEINAPIEKVWAVLGNFQDMSWNPAVSKTEGTGGNDAGATRAITLATGVLNQKLVKYDADAKQYAFESADDTKVLPVTNLASNIAAKGTGDKTIVEWRASFYRGFVNNDPPPELSDEAAQKAIEEHTQKGLLGLKAKLEAGG